MHLITFTNIYIYEYYLINILSSLVVNLMSEARATTRKVNIKWYHRENISFTKMTLETGTSLVAYRCLSLNYVLPVSSD